VDPLVSVVLPVYNCPDYVDAAVRSILDQTFENFELILIDDGSTDATPAVLSGYADPRIKLITQANRGLAATLNRGVELARGRYIARQDQDDISLPERLAKQVAFLEAHPRCALIGTWAQIWLENTATDRVHRHPSDNSGLQFELLFNNPFVHSSVMLRKAALVVVGGYSTDRNRQPPEDYELWSRIAREYEVANIPEVLHTYREVKGSMSREGVSPFLNHLVTLCAENIAWAAQRSASDPQVVNLAALIHGAPHRLQGKPQFSDMHSILRRATIRVVAEPESARFVKEARARVDALRYRWWELRYGNDWRRYLLKAARRMLGTLRRV